jgi:hypothetical protein
MKDINQLKHDHHFQISAVKSAFRLIACGSVILAGVDALGVAALLFGLSEVLGVLEELV